MKINIKEIQKLNLKKGSIILIKAGDNNLSSAEFYKIADEIRNLSKKISGVAPPILLLPENLELSNINLPQLAEIRMRIDSLITYHTRKIGDPKIAGIS